MVKVVKIARALEAARASFEHEIHRIAELAHDQLVPYFQKRGWSYVAGNGTWFIEDRRGRRVEDDFLPKAVRSVLWLEVEHGQHLGFFIRDRQ